MVYTQVVCNDLASSFTIAVQDGEGLFFICYGSPVFIFGLCFSSTCWPAEYNNSGKSRINITHPRTTAYVPKKCDCILNIFFEQFLYLLRMCFGRV